jgi:hypothetical protein
LIYANNYQRPGLRKREGYEFWEGGREPSMLAKIAFTQMRFTFAECLLTTLDYKEEIDLFDESSWEKRTSPNEKEGGNTPCGIFWSMAYLRLAPL